MNFDPMTPIWAQVATHLKQRIVTGELPPGSKLPGGRDLALEYGIKRNRHFCDGAGRPDSDDEGPYGPAGGRPVSG